MKFICFFVSISLALGAVAYGFLIEPDRLEIRHVRMHGCQLGAALRGKTVVHLTDLHIRRLGERDKRVLDVVRKISPDLVLLTGDYVQWEDDTNAALDFLANLGGRVGVFGVMGDYDYSNSRKSCLFCHEAGSGKPTKRHNVRFLRNSVEALSLPEGTVWIAGLDPENGDPGEVRKTLAAWRGKEPMILLSHNPLNFDLLDEGQDVLMLSGDTHGGQIPLPSWLWRLLGYEKNAKYPEGLFVKGKKRLFVSRGIGTSHIPFRLFKRPEVVVLKFE